MERTGISSSIISKTVTVAIHTHSNMAYTFPAKKLSVITETRPCNKHLYLGLKIEHFQLENFVNLAQHISLWEHVRTTSPRRF